MDQPTAEEALRRLEPLVGEWTFEATWPNGEVWQGGGRVTFEWTSPPTSTWSIAESQPTPGIPPPDDAL